MKKASHSHAHGHRLDTLHQTFLLGILLNITFVVAEGAIGFYYDSLSLLSDAGHNLSDVFSLLLALLAFRLAKVPANSRYTYGYKKSTVLVSLLNAVILLVAVGAIVVESVHKLSHPTVVNGDAIAWTAGAGILVNGLTAWLLFENKKKDLNVKGAYLHMAADTLVSVGVLVSGLLIAWTGYAIIDPIVGLLIAVVILVSTWRLLADSLRLALDGVPGDTDLNAVRHMLEATEGVKAVHHLHIWAMSTTQNALTAHVALTDVGRLEATKRLLKEELKTAGIDHATLEFEVGPDPCPEENCR